MDSLEALSSWVCLAVYQSIFVHDTDEAKGLYVIVRGVLQIYTFS